jgi:hypothetical protein
MAESVNDSVNIPHDIIIMSKCQFCKKCGKTGIEWTTSCTKHSEQYLAEVTKMEVHEKIEMAKLAAQNSAEATKMEVQEKIEMAKLAAQNSAEATKMEMQEKIEMAKLSSQKKTLNTIALFVGNAVYYRYQIVFIL